MEQDPANFQVDASGNLTVPVQPATVAAAPAPVAAAQVQGAQPIRAITFKHIGAQSGPRHFPRMEDEEPAIADIEDEAAFPEVKKPQLGQKGKRSGAMPHVNKKQWRKLLDVDEQDIDAAIAEVLAMDGPRPRNMETEAADMTVPDDDAVSWASGNYEPRELCLESCDGEAEDESPEDPSRELIDDFKLTPSPLEAAALQIFGPAAVRPSRESDADRPPITDESRPSGLADIKTRQGAPLKAKLSREEGWTPGKQARLRIAQRGLIAQTGVTQGELDRMSDMDTLDLFEELKMVVAKEKQEPAEAEHDLHARDLERVTQEEKSGEHADRLELVDSDDDDDGGKRIVDDPAKAAAEVASELRRGSWANSIWPKMPLIGCINQCNPTVVVNAVTSSLLKAGWRRLEVMMDSGAAESVIPQNEIPECPLRAHKHDIYYATATGEPILILGEQQLPTFTASGRPCSMTFQACDVSKPLASVRRMVQARSALVFAPDDWGGPS